MKLRTQLVLAFLLLAVVPLTGIVLYSYYTSLRAVRQATETEARTLSKEMDGRMASIRSDLGAGVQRMGGVPVQDLMDAAEARRQGKPDPLLGRMVLGFGDAAPLVRSLEFIPAPPAAQRSAGIPPAEPAPPAPPQAPAPPVKVVIDVHQILREVGKELKNAADAEGLSPERRRQLAEKLAKAEEDRRAAEEADRQIQRDRAVLGRAFEAPVWNDRGAMVGTIRAQVHGDEVLRRVLAHSRAGEGEIPFALDAQGNLHTVSAEDQETIRKLPLVVGVRKTSARWAYGDWVFATTRDPESGVAFGIARRVPLAEVRRTAARNFGYGLGMIGLALLGILPLSGRVTRDLKLVTEGAGRIAQGNLETRVPVRSRNEIGKLASTFNQMAEELRVHQNRLLEQERLRQQREIEQALLQTEYDRKSAELEEARRFQLSLLPKTLPEHPGFEVAVSMRTATEVGGDYYDFHLGADGALTAAIGDATGHGARAGTMVTAVKSLFSAFAGQRGPRELLDEAARAVRRMELGRMAMGLAVARLRDCALTLSSAGMPPVLIYRAAHGKAEEISLQGMPLGGFAFDYEERRLDLSPGDAILMMTDGLPELANGEGDPLGYPRVRTLFEELGGQAPEEIIAGLSRAAEAWTAGEPVKDDVTLVVVRVR
ncbi:MAG TPA: SpoIIE family protein phosphatase [Thermoanaerobaculia bacterium]|nr:SpoIIE family protein phosphatase [Thermoanaerobaculia bacterium]